MLAQLDYQDAAREFSAQLGETMRLAQTRLQERLAARAEKNEPVTSARALFDEWVEAGEQAWAERAGSDAFVAQYDSAGGFRWVAPLQLSPGNTNFGIAAGMAASGGVSTGAWASSPASACWSDNRRCNCSRGPSSLEASLAACAPFLRARPSLCIRIARMNPPASARNGLRAG